MHLSCEYMNCNLVQIGILPRLSCILNGKKNIYKVSSYGLLLFYLFYLWYAKCCFHNEMNSIQTKICVLTQNALWTLQELDAWVELNWISFAFTAISHWTFWFRQWARADYCLLFWNSIKINYLFMGTRTSHVFLSLFSCF